MPRIRTQPSLNRDFTLLSVFIVFILLLVSAWVTKETIDNYHRETTKRLESEAIRLDRALIVEIENASYILESIGRQIQSNGPEKQEQIAQLFFSFDKTAAPKLGNFSWCTGNQMLTVSSNLGVLKEPIDVSDRDYIKKSIADPGKIHIGRPIEGRLSQKWVLPMSLGLTDTSGHFLGTVVIGLDTDRLSDDVSRTLKDGDVRFAITNTALTLLTQNATSANFFTQTLPQKQLQSINFDKATSGEFSSGSLWNNTALYSYYERSSEYPYIIFLGLNPEKSHNALHTMLMPRLFQLLIIALFLLFVLYSVRTRIIQPVMVLTERTARVVRGENFQHDSNFGPLEIEQLSSEIKRLHDFLKERQRVELELRQKNTELNRIKDAAQLTNQVKAEFFAFVGSELAEPAETILALIETLKDAHFGPLGNPIYQQHAREIYDQSQQLLMMLNDIKAISEAETGLLALQEGEVDIAFTVKKAARIFRDRTNGTPEVVLDLPVQLPHLRGDELRVKQLVLNILTAAARHVGSGDTIRLHAIVKAQEVMLQFSYANIHALSGSTLGQPSTRPRHGLEMALARLLVAMHQGALEMKTLQDRTTMITVRFPAIRVIN